MSAVGGWGGWGWYPHWHNHVVVVNNYFITGINFVHGGDFRHATGTQVWRIIPIIVSASPIPTTNSLTISAPRWGSPAGLPT